MCLNYETQVEFVVVGTKSGTTRTAATLTNAYSGGLNKTFAVGGMSKLNLDLLYTTGAAETSNSVEIQVECSPDGTNFYRIPNENVSAGVSTLTQREFTFVGAAAATAYTISLGLDIFYEYVKVSFKESGVAANAGTLYCEGTLSGK